MPVTVPVTDPDALPLPVKVAVTVTVAETVAVPVPLAVAEGVTHADGFAEGDGSRAPVMMSVDGGDSTAPNVPFPSSP